MINATIENAKTLAALMGLDETEAAELLDIDLSVSDDGSQIAAAISRQVTVLLKRTVASVGESDHPTVEVLVGVCALPEGNRSVRVAFDGSMIQIGRKATGGQLPPLSPPGTLVIACYAAAAAIRLACSKTFKTPFHDPIRIDPNLLVIPQSLEIGEVHLAGAGAIGNGFLYALAGLDMSGIVHVVDPKLVTSGNLNRCLLFTEADVGVSKAIALAHHAAPLLPKAKLIPHHSELSKLACGQPPQWLKRLVVGVDSRRARRHLQEELPREVYDASTTGMEEIVLHFNERLNPSCLSCVYHENDTEDAHERHVANVLGVTLEQVKMQFVDHKAALAIAYRYPDLPPEQIVGRAFDSLFKALCGAGQLTVGDSRTVLAPLSFVSVLAGAWLAIEFLRRIATGNAQCDFNFWRMSPWTSPVVELRQDAVRRHDCRCCGSVSIHETVRTIWL